MTEKRQVWVHGTAAQVEYPDELRSYVRRGWGTQYNGKSDSKNWFHFSIPTPALIDGVPPVLRKIYILYNDKNLNLVGYGIDNVHIYDGPNKIFSFDGLGPEFSGDHSKQIDEFNCWELEYGVSSTQILQLPTRILFGVGISVGVKFLTGGDGVGIEEIIFTAAGAEFTYEPTVTFPIR